MKKPIRVLHTVVNMNRGGAETLIMNIYRNIDRSKIQFDFLVSNDGVFDNEIISLGGKIYKTPYINEVGPLKYNKNIMEFFSAHSDYKVVHCHMDKLCGCILRAAKRGGIQSRIAHSHSSSSGGNIINNLVKSYYGSFIPYVATSRFACSNLAAKFLFKELDCKIINNGINVNEYTFSRNIRADMRSELNVLDKFVVGHVGRFSEAKNHMFLLEIFKCIRSRNPNAILLLVGGGSLKKKVENKINELELNDSVKLLGVRDDVNQVLQACDVFLFPSLHEGLGIALIEAQASGLVCFTSKNTVPQEATVTDIIRYIPLENNADYWATRVLEYANGYERKNKYSEIVKAGFDIKDTARYLQEFYLKEVRNYE